MEAFDSLQHARSLLDSLPDALLVLSSETRVLFANQAAKRLLSLGAALKPDDTLADVFSLADANQPRSWITKARADDGWQGTLVGKTQAGLSLILEGQLQPTDEHHPFPHAFLLSLHDVTQKQRLWEMLSESHGRMVDLVYLMNEGVIIHDGNTILEVNKAMADTLGYHREDLLGAGIFGTIAPEFRELVRQKVAENNLESYEVTLMHKGGQNLHVNMQGKICSYNGKPARAVLVRDMTEFKKREDQYRFVSHITDKSPVAIAALDESLRITYVNEALISLYGYTKEEILGKPRDVLMGRNPVPGDSFIHAVDSDLEAKGVFRVNDERRRKDGTVFPSASSLTAVRDEKGRLVCYSDVSMDISSKLAKEKENEQLRLQLFQSQKLEAIGQMAAGIAHEINTPTQYIGDNLRFLDEIRLDLDEVETLHKALITKNLNGDADTELAQRIVSLEEEKDWDFIMKEIPLAVRQTQEGAERVLEIVRAFKEFSHPGNKEFAEVSLNEAIRNAITVARNEWKYVAEVETDLAQDLPMIQGLSGELNQVLLNMIVNAAHAIEEAVEQGVRQKGMIRIETRNRQDHVELCIQDTGMGIPEEIQHRIFDPFFTTKKYGKGTGQGLALTYSIVVKHHQGNIRFTTKPKEGTRFIIALPIHHDPNRDSTVWGLF